MVYRIINKLSKNRKSFDVTYVFVK